MQYPVANVPLEHPLIQSYRELLRVTRDADDDALKKAFRLMAKIYHPDHNADANAQTVFMRIREAYQVLNDPAAMARLNSDYQRKKMIDVCVKGLDLRMGSLFGHRLSSLQHRRVDPCDVSWEGEKLPIELDAHGNAYYTGDNSFHASIMDHPDLDLVEVIYAGEFSLADEFRLARAFRERDFNNLPWFVLNNQGITHFIENDYRAALACYDALNERIRNNIVFLYRLGVCHAIMAFRETTTHLFLFHGPNQRSLNHAIRCMKEAIHLGATRPYAPQRCMTIRKTLADLLQAAGRPWQAWLQWKAIQRLAPFSAETKQKLEETRPAIAGLLTGSQKKR